MMRLAGIHHITAIARDGEECIDFYGNALGLRLVKVTINYDDPGSYHFYFGDHRGTPGTLLTFFLWPGAPAPGNPAERGQVERIAYAIPAGSVDHWRERLAQHEIEHEIEESNDARLIALRDPDGMRVDLAESAKGFADVEPAKGAPQECAIRAFAGATLAESDLERSATFLEETLGLQRIESHNQRLRLHLEDGSELQLVHRENAAARSAAMGPGVVHHIAFRAADDDEQIRWRERIAQTGNRVTAVRERTYFRSIYFREPGGVLFEIATVRPGMTIDEPLEELGHRLMLPKWLEAKRTTIASHLPALISPETGTPIAGAVEV